MDTNSYLVFLLVGVVLVIADGQIIYRSGRRLLRQAGSDAGSAESQTRLVVVLFHFIALGVVLLASTIGTWETMTGVVARLGLLLLFLAVAHWAAISALTNQRDREGFRARRAARQQARQGGVADLGAGPDDTPSYVSPTIEETDPYRR